MPDHRLTVTVLLAAMVTGCASPGTPLPRAPILPNQAWATEADAIQWPEHAWWETFDSADLNDWVKRSLAGNAGLREAASRLDAAEAVARQSRAGTRPRGDASASSIYQRYSEHAGHEAPMSGGRGSTNTLDVSLRYSLDFWGRNRAALRAALGEAAAQKSEWAAARQILVGKVVQTWVELAWHLEQQKLFSDAVAVRQRRLQLVRQRVAAGLDSPSASLQAEAEVSESLSDLAGIKEAIARRRHALAELAGEGVQAADGLTPALADPAALDIPAAIPATLLGRRADIVAARQRVEAADARTEHARASFYPDVNLRAFAGLTSLGLSQWLEAGSRTYGLEPAISLPLFDGGRLRGELKQREAEYNQAVEQYNGLILRAAREVADALASIDAVAQQRDRQRHVIATAEAAHALALRRYAQGQDSHLSVLATETSWLEARATGIDLRARALELQAELAVALGGGFGSTAHSSPSAASEASSQTAAVARLP